MKFIVELIVKNPPVMSIVVMSVFAGIGSRKFNGQISPAQCGVSLGIPCQTFKPQREAVICSTL